MSRRTILIAGAALTVAISRVAAAQDTSAAGTAESSFREGTRLFDEKRYDLACPKFAESFRLDPATGSLLALAVCHEAQGKTASAWAEYNEVVVRARRQGRTDRADAAQRRADELEPTLSRLTVMLDAAAAPIAGLVVKRDGLAVGPGSLGVAVPIDPGEHAIEATAPARRPWSTRVVLVAGGPRATVVVPSLPEAIPTQDTAARPLSSSPLRSIGLIASGAGAGALGLSGYFALQAVDKNNQSKADCTGDACGTAGKQARYDALSAGNTATIAFVAGSALLACGVALFVIDVIGKHRQDGPSLVASASVDGRATGVTLAGSF
jgi:hypothetical protein